MTKNEDTALMPIEQIGSSILLLRGCRVIWTATLQRSTA